MTMNNHPRGASYSSEVLRATVAVVTGLTALHFLSTVPAHAQMQFGEPIKTANINLGPPIGEGGPNLSSDGLTMYFHSNQRPGPDYPIGRQTLGFRNSWTVWGASATTQVLTKELFLKRSGALQRPTR